MYTREDYYNEPYKAEIESEGREKQEYIKEESKIASEDN